MNYFQEEIKKHIEYLKSVGEIYRSISHLADELAWNDIYVTKRILIDSMYNLGYKKTKDNYWVL